MKKTLSALLLLVFISFGLCQTVYAAEQKAPEDYMPSLITKTPLEGRMLAIKIIRKTIGTIQQDSEIKQAVRKKYEDDPQLLMYAAELVAIEFKTIAIANNYWRDVR
ncbi:MAG: hexameric tyrosine-coordinated heme protein [Desulfuromonadaceae bacterium]|nr:hexameric tyrosine-coordinated heme protein [Desulfuromonadaceae bacterium]